MKKLLRDYSGFEKILLLLSCFVLVSLLVFTFTGANLSFNSDTATANLLAEEMVRTGQYFPKDWVAGQDLWVFFLHTFIAVFTLFSDDFFFMRSLASVIFIIMAVLSVIYCSRKVTKNNSWLISVPLMFCGVSAEYSTVVFGQCAYITPLIYSFFFIALFINCIDANTYKITSKIKFIVLLVLTAFVGLGGIRPVQVFGLPIVGTVVIYYFLNNYKKSNKEFIKGLKSPAVPLIGFIAAIAVGYVGFIYCSNLITFSAGGTDVHISDFDIFTRIKTFVNLFIGLFGLSYNVSLFSVDGILTIIKLVFGILLLIVFPILQIRNYNKEEETVKIFIIFAVLHIIEMLILCIICGLLSDATRYLFTMEFLLLFMSGHYIYKRWINGAEEILKTVAILAVYIYILPISFPKLTSFIGYSEQMAERCEVTDYLKSKGLNYGFATYWNAGVNTCYSNGEVELNNIVISDKLYKYYWLNSKAWYEKDSDNSFLLLTEEENELYKNTSTINLLGAPVSVENYKNYWIYVYDYNIALNDFDGRGYDNFEVLDRMVCSEEARSDKGIVMDLDEDRIIYGPYIDIPAGKYHIVLQLDGIDNKIYYHLSENAGEIMQEGEITGNEHEISFNADHDISDFEIVIYDSDMDNDVVVKSIRLSDAA